MLTGPPRTGNQTNGSLPRSRSRRAMQPPTHALDQRCRPRYPREPDAVCVNARGTTYPGNRVIAEAEATVCLLAELLRNPSVPARKRGAGWLGVAARSAIPALQTAASDKSRKVRRTARCALIANSARTTSEQNVVLAAILEQPADTTRATAGRRSCARGGASQRRSVARFGHTDRFIMRRRTALGSGGTRRRIL